MKRSVPNWAVWAAHVRRTARLILVGASIGYGVAVALGNEGILGAVWACWAMLGAIYLKMPERPAAPSE